MKIISKSISYLPVSIFLFFALMMVVPETHVYAQDLEDVTSEVDNVTDDVIDLAKAVLRIGLIIMFVFTILNYAFNFTNQRNVILTFVVVLILYGIFAGVSGSF